MPLPFRGQSVQLQVHDMRAELAQANISRQLVGDNRIAIPAKAEQHAIDAMLDSVDKTIERGHEEQDGLQSPKAPAADVLLTGRAANDNPSGETQWLITDRLAYVLSGAS